MKMHQLQDNDKPHGYVKFKLNGDTHVYYFCVNQMSGCMMDWFDFDPPKVGRSISEIKQTIQRFKKDADEVVSEYLKFK